ncbi:hypothetical protein RJ639_047492 [Escallonia herrerae]|uniref:RING-type E3 ubiquitin transferase n=1 Tax=Escallonia herrerae TaxID=1293975 RepID=A0AA88W9Q6_9ASTE|nr:hypothetical protein RJ639_047492 [Escallonia herrerae]
MMPTRAFSSTGSQQPYVQNDISNQQPYVSDGSPYNGVSSQRPVPYQETVRVHYLGVYEQRHYVTVEHPGGTCYIDVVDRQPDYPLYYSTWTPYGGLHSQQSYFPVDHSDGSRNGGIPLPHLPVDYSAGNLYNGNPGPYLPVYYSAGNLYNGILAGLALHHYIADDIGILDDLAYHEQWWNHELLVSAEQSCQSGLLGETISQHLRTRTHVKAANQEPEICVICQVEYEDDETIGGLQCGHEYHADCVKKWLLKKNVCPLCNATALKL